MQHTSQPASHQSAARHRAPSTTALQPVRRGPAPLHHRAITNAVAVARRTRRASHRLASEVGQGTVEYVGLLLLMASLLAAIVTAAHSLGGQDAIGKKVVTQIGKSIDTAGGAKAADR